MKGFQIGKDLSSLYWLKELSNEKSKIIVDRGILSSVYYSYLLKRIKEKEILKLLDEVAKYKEFKFIFILAKNNERALERMKQDGFDNLPKKENLKTMCFIKKECEKRKIDLKIFYNDFDKSILENGKKLKEIIYER